LTKADGSLWVNSKGFPASQTATAKRAPNVMIYLARVVTPLKNGVQVFR
jgi:hypothetical protein